MEEALFNMQRRNNELTRAQRDATDSPANPKYMMQHEHSVPAMTEKETVHKERFVEMVSFLSFILFCSVLTIKVMVVELESAAFCMLFEMDACIELARSIELNVASRCRLVYITQLTRFASTVMSFSFPHALLHCQYTISNNTNLS